MAIDLLLLHYNGKLCSINMESNFFIILGNQLFNPKILNKNNCNEVFMAEDLGLCTYFKHHKAKLYLFLTSMREYRDELTKNSIKVNYFKLDERDDNDKYSIFLAKFLKPKKINHIHMFEIEDKEFELELVSHLKKEDIEITFVKSPMFLFKREDFWEESLLYKILKNNYPIQNQKKQINHFLY